MPVIQPITRLCLLVAGSVLLFGTIIGCERQSTTEAAAEHARLEEAPDQESWDVRFAVYNDNRPRAEIRAFHMAQFTAEDSTYTVFQGDREASPPGRVSAQLYDEQGDSSAVIWADKMIYLEDDRQFDAEGNVRVETADERHVEGEHLAWFEEDRQVRTPGFVRIRTPTDRVQGYGLVANEDISSYQLANVTGETHIDDL